MSFTQQVFIRKNTPELRDKLKKLGYRLCSCCDYLDGWLFTIEDNVHRIAEYEKEIFLEDVKFYEKSMIDCGENKSLFLAIAALRTDSDCRQYFVADFDIDDGDGTDIKYQAGNLYIYETIKDYILLFHKATVQELIEHFGSNINVGSK